jgi:hypothetical protein
VIRDLYIKANATAATSSVGATLMKTGQTTSYRTGDDGDLEAGRATSFTVLASNNPFGNTNRFTDELGGSTYTNNIVIDWSTYNGSTVNGYRRNLTGANITWDSAIDTCLALSIGTFTTGWRLFNANEMMSLIRWGGTAALNYAPFNISVGVSIWCSTTLPYNSGYAMLFQNTTYQMLYQSKTVGAYWIPVRTFTVTGTTLT